MKLKAYGTRGSVAVSNPNSVRFGGNTTCIKMESECFPPNTWLVIDAGSGYVPMGNAALSAGIKNIFLLMTHYHHDHTGGMLLSPPTYIKSLKMDIWGPVDRELGPEKIYRALMQRPFFPVDWPKVASHFHFKGIKVPESNVILIHPEGGFKMIPMDQYETIENNGGKFDIGKGRYPKKECMVIHMVNTLHPDITVSYRFDEGPTGKSFVFLTDHENTDGLSASMKNHLMGADLVLMDCQYSREKYANCVGYGHATPDYCVNSAIATGVKSLGLTHHDPGNDDEAVLKIEAEARRILAEAKSGGAKTPLSEKSIFACEDYKDIVL